MSRYTAAYFRDNLPEWKRLKDPILSRMFYRQVSFYLSALFCRCGITANMVSYASAVIAIFGCALFVLNHSVLGALMVNLWLLLDCADGNIARSFKAERFGQFADSMSSYICVGFLFSCVGFAVYHQGGFIVAPGMPEIILAGSVASSCDSLTRLLYQKYLNVSYQMGLDAHVNQDGSNANVLDRLRIKIDQYVSVGGFLPAILLVCAFMKALDVVVLFWCAYYVLLFVATSLYLVRKTFIANRD